MSTVDDERFKSHCHGISIAAVDDGGFIFVVFGDEIGAGDGRSRNFRLKIGECDAAKVAVGARFSL